MTRPSKSPKAPSLKASTTAAATSARAPDRTASTDAAAPARPLASAAPFDRTEYTTLPAFDLTLALATSRTLLQRSSFVEPASLVEERDRMRDVAAQCEAAMIARLGVTSLDLRPYDADMDRAWRLFVTRLRDLAELPVARTPQAAVAAKIVAMLGDLTILSLPYRSEHTEIQTRLTALTQAGLLDDARALAGEFFYAEVQHCHAEYGRVLGITAPLPDKSADVDLLEHLRALTASMTDYVFQVLATVRSSVPESAEVARKALAPIDDARTTIARRRAEPATNGAPVPAPTPAPLPTPSP